MKNMIRKDVGAENYSLEKRIIDANISSHKEIAHIYEQLNPQMYNFYEIRNLSRDIRFIKKHLIMKDSPPCALDIGCGNGYLSIRFLKEGFKVIAVDMSKEKLDELILNLKNSPEIDAKNLEIVNEEINTFLSAANREIDVAMCSSTLHHLPDYFDTLAKVNDLLKSGGILYIFHEPVLKEDRKQTIFARGLSFLDWNFYYFYLRIKGIKVPKCDWEYCDYHSKYGCDQNNLKEFFEEMGYDIIKFRMYNSRQYGIFALIDNWLIHSDRLAFKIIARKR